jgi:hypothetical protein
MTNVSVSWAQWLIPFLSTTHPICSFIGVMVRFKLPDFRMGWTEVSLDAGIKNVDDIKKAIKEICHSTLGPYPADRLTVLAANQQGDALKLEGNRELKDVLAYFEIETSIEEAQSIFEKNISLTVRIPSKCYSDSLQVSLSFSIFCRFYQ